MLNNKNVQGDDLMVGVFHFWQKLGVFLLTLTVTIIVTQALLLTSSQAQMSADAKVGRFLFYDPSFGGSVDPLKATGLACSSCHADFDEKEKSDGLIRCGHTIVGVVNRQKSQWKQITPETYQRTAGGAGVCYQQYLQAIPPSAVDPLAIPESQAKALMAYFDYVTKQESSSAGYAGPKFTYAPLAPEEAKLAAQKIMKLNGDRDRGWKLYGRSCATCHSGPKRGRGLGTRLVRARPYANLKSLQARLLRIAIFVRHGGPMMPAMGEDILSDQDDADISAFLAKIAEPR